MTIIKLDAIDSTNSYLKKMASEHALKNFTTVTTSHQLNGRGQVGTKWFSEKDKNLTFSMLVKLKNFKLKHQFYLSIAVSIAVFNVLKKYKVTSCIKWPNDILAGKDKVAGILIENVIAGELIKQSVIGIGLNVNQTTFSKQLKNVTSLKNFLNLAEEIDLDMLLQQIISEIKKQVKYIENEEFEMLKQTYLAHLFKRNKPSMFINENENYFLGKIIDVNEEGKLLVELENEKIRKFDLKEIKFADRI